MKTFRYAERAARLLRSARARIRPHRSGESADAIALLAEAIPRSAAGRRRRRLLAAIGAAAAVGVAAVVIAIPWRPPGARARREVAPAVRPRLMTQTQGSAAATMTAAEGRAQAIPAGHAWLPNERLQSGAAPLSLEAADGTTIDLQPRSALNLIRADAERWLRLGSGGVSVHVAKLKAGERFVIVTPDAEVEVRGTRFHVALVAPADDCGQGTTTRVVVDEGVVVVRSPQGEVRVEAGKSWPAGCRPGPAAPPARAVAKRTSKSVPPPERAAGGEVAPSTLATENDLFSAALKAERSGDRRAAAQLLDVLVARFPQSPLKESAERARARLTETEQATP